MTVLIRSFSLYFISCSDSEIMQLKIVSVVVVICVVGLVFGVEKNEKKIAAGEEVQFDAGGDMEQIYREKRGNRCWLTGESCGTLGFCFDGACNRRGQCYRCAYSG